MKINKIKVNGFGNLQNKEIELNPHINIIQGKNESGKSTLLKFMVNMFYGISKNKRGKEISDYEKFKPWNTEEFSGKIQYELDNQKKYELFRDFNKKNPKLYNENLEDISSEFNTNKTNGNQFFYEQTKIDEEMFLSSLVSMQQEVKLEKNVQNTMIQKLSNLAGTGDDNTSYQKAIDKLNKKQVEEIGNYRTQGRPINLLEKREIEVRRELTETNCFKDKKYEMEKIKNELKQKIEKEELKLKYLKEIEKIKLNKKIIEEKIKIKEEIKNNTQEKIKQLKEEKNKEKNNDVENEKQEINKIKNKLNKNKINIGMFILSSIILIVNLLFIKNNIINIIDGIFILIFFILFIILQAQGNKKIQKIKEKIKNRENKNTEEIEKINTQIEILEKNNKEQEEEIQKIKEKNNFEMNLQLEKIKKENKIIEEINLKLILENIENEIEKIQNNNNKNKLELHRMQIDAENIMQKLEKLSQLEEEKKQIEQEKEDLLKDNLTIELAKATILEAYQKMKESVTPKFAQNLSANISHISNHKYKNVRIHDEEGIIVEKENGEYITAENLSVGTIDQLYISLRLAIIGEICEESMPIILDESFAYYDTERLKNILIYLDEKFKNSQIIIFTCTNREKEILEKEEIEYECIDL